MAHTCPPVMLNSRHKLILAVRSEARGEAARRQQLLNGRDKQFIHIEVWKLDLGSCNSIITPRLSSDLIWWPWMTSSKDRWTAPLTTKNALLMTLLVALISTYFTHKHYPRSIPDHSPFVAIFWFPCFDPSADLRSSMTKSQMFPRTNSGGIFWGSWHRFYRLRRISYHENRMTCCVWFPGIGKRV